MLIITVQPLTNKGGPVKSWCTGWVPMSHSARNKYLKVKMWTSWERGKSLVCVCVVCAYLWIKSVCPRLCCHLQLWARTKMEALLRGAGPGQKVSNRKTHHNFSSTHSDNNYVTLESNIYVCKPSFYSFYQKDRGKVDVKKKKWFSQTWVILSQYNEAAQNITFYCNYEYILDRSADSPPLFVVLGQMSTLRVRYLTPKRPLIVWPPSLLARGQQDVWPGSN